MRYWLLPLIAGTIMTLTTTQQPDTRTSADELAKAFVSVSDFLLRSAEMVPAARYGERPVANIRTFLRLIAHVADGNNYYCRLAEGTQVEWAETAENESKDRAAAIAALRASIGRCRAVYARADAKQGPLIENLAHASLHYGNVIVYLRAMGYTPPSS